MIEESVQLARDPRHHPSLGCETWGTHHGEIPLFVPRALMRDAVSAILDGARLVLLAGVLAKDGETRFVRVDSLLVSGEDKAEKTLMEQLIDLASKLVETEPGLRPVVWLYTDAADNPGLWPTEEACHVHRAFLPESWQSVGLIERSMSAMALYRMVGSKLQRHGLFLTTEARATASERHTSP